MFLVYCLEKGERMNSHFEKVNCASAAVVVDLKQTQVTFNFRRKEEKKSLRYSRSADNTPPLSFASPFCGAARLILEWSLEYGWPIFTAYANKEMYRQRERERWKGNESICDTYHRTMCDMCSYLTRIFTPKDAIWNFTSFNRSLIRSRIFEELTKNICERESSRDKISRRRGSTKLETHPLGYNTLEWNSNDIWRRLTFSDLVFFSFFFHLFLEKIYPIVFFPAGFRFVFIFIRCLAGSMWRNGPPPDFHLFLSLAQSNEFDIFDVRLRRCCYANRDRNRGYVVRIKNILQRVTRRRDVFRFRDSIRWNGKEALYKRWGTWARWISNCSFALLERVNKSKVEIRFRIQFQMLIANYTEKNTLVRCIRCRNRRGNKFIWKVASFDWNEARMYV